MIPSTNNLLLPTLLTLLATIPSSHAVTVTSTIVLSASAPQATSPSYTSDSTYRTNMLTAHNFYRKAHNASDLVWNDTLAQVASDWSDGCVFEHSGLAYGENLATGYPNATSNVDAWALERTMYDFNRPGFAAATGHFTQLVWRNTTSVGCGRTSCNSASSKGWLVVCEYWPAGNVLGSGGDTTFFRENVLRQVLGKAGDTVGSGVSATSDGVRGMLGVELWVLVGVGAVVVGFEW